MKQIFKLAAERVVQLESFSKFKVEISGEPKLSSRPIFEIEDTIETFSVEVLEVPVRVTFSDIPINPLDPLTIEPSIEGILVIPVEGSTHKIEADFSDLGKQRKERDNQNQ